MWTNIAITNITWQKYHLSQYDIINYKLISEVRAATMPTKHYWRIAQERLWLTLVFSWQLTLIQWLYITVNVVCTNTHTYLSLVLVGNHGCEQMQKSRRPMWDPEHKDRQNKSVHLFHLQQSTQLTDQPRQLGQHSKPTGKKKNNYNYVQYISIFNMKFSTDMSP